MKKTLSLLLLTAGCAMAATEVDLTGKWDGNTANLSEVDYSGGQFSVVLTLDMSKLRGDTYFFTVEGSNPNGVTTSSTIGYGYDSWQGLTKLVIFEGILDDKNKAFTNTKNLGSYAVDGQYYQGKDWESDYTEVAYTTMVFNYSYSYDAVNDVHHSSYNMTMLKWDKNGNLVVDPIYRENTRKGFGISGQLTMLAISSNNVKDIELYTGNFSAEESKEQANRMADELFGRTNAGGDTEGNVPEPTTATLSLLALAALSARRRRK